MGLPWKSSVVPKDETVPFNAYGGNLDDLVSTAYEFNPDWKELDAGLQALEGEEKTAASGYFPKIGLKGELHKRWNAYDGGLSTPQNKQGWSVDLGVEFPIFDGFLTREKVAEARAKINQLKEKKLLLSEGLGLQLRSMFLDLEANEKVVKATEDAAAAAKDDTELTLRGYQTGLVETEKVIRAQLQEALVTASRDKAIYDHIALQSKIELTVSRRCNTGDCAEGLFDAMPCRVCILGWISLMRASTGLRPGSSAQETFGRQCCWRFWSRPQDSSTRRGSGMERCGWLCLRSRNQCHGPRCG